MVHSSNRRQFLKGSAAAALAQPQPSFAAASKLLASAGSPPPNGYKEQPLIYAREAVLLSETFPSRTKIFVQAIRIGNLGIAITSARLSSRWAK
jgi:hypothetical protein